MPRPAASPLLLVGFGLAFLAFGQAVAPPPLAAAATARAAPAAGDPPAPLGRQVRTAVAEVLSSPDFATEDQRIRWVPRSPGAKAAADSDWEWPLVPRVPHRVQVRLLAAACAGALAWALLRWRRAWLLPGRSRAGAGGRPDAAGADAPPLTVHGLDVRPSSLPADVPVAAWQLWERGEAASALSLLYRGALAALLAATAIRFAESWTEGDCLLAVRRHAAAAGAAAAAAGAGAATDAGTGAGIAAAAEPLFARLTASWQAVAYGRREPDAPDMRDLCAGWSRTFGAADAAVTGAAGPSGAAAGSVGAAAGS
ncbi:MAG TPA: hypothetical protein VMW75_03025 [Thermoanaerobaculia bacterium]|nr:hypothetical protein [Thermoanaerobaculia bacterium]